MRSTWMVCAAMAAMAACGGTAARPAAERVTVAVDASLDAGVDAGIDAMPDAAPDAEASVGAMPVPEAGEPWRVAGIDEVDTSVTIEEVRAVRGWPTARHIAMRGPVMLALHAERDGLLHLTVIEREEGSRADFELGAVTPETFDHTFDGNAYLSRQGAEGTGPIVFAVRVLPPAGSATTTRRQVVVFSDAASLRVVERPVGAGAWRPRLRIDFATGTTFVGIGTTDPH